ncbi:SAF domain-containing protein [Cellulosimicrobium arenosum]|uniref:Flagellar biosynthesis protein FlgA n=1 Tax=Cellulosimicrobium arenosum TaxID=2708133 RepID=A0A927IZZ0_9MICO|nr:flagellar biosynthesis protein FlgA [Cellulosimicrobium arenosum]
MPRSLRALWWRGRFVVAAACCALAAGAVVQAARPAPPPTVTAVVTAHEVSGGTRLAAGDLRVVETSPDLVPADAPTGVDAAVGRTTSVRLAAGTVLQDSLVGAGDLVAGAPQGTVVVPVHLEPTVSTLLVPGDRVDLVLAAGRTVADPLPDDGTDTTADGAVGGASDPYLARRALVVPGRATSGAGGLLGAAGPSAEGGVTLVAVSAQEAARLAGATGWEEVRAVLVP